MDIQLSRDADMVVCQIYKEYLKRIESGTPKADAKIFKDVDGFIKTYFPNMDKMDFVDILSELRQTLNLRIYVNASFQLSNEAIIYMENRFKNGTKQILDWLGKIKGIIPFV